MPHKFNDDGQSIQISFPNNANLQLPDPDLLMYYRDTQERIFWISGEIDADTLSLIQHIVHINRDDKDVKSH